MISIEFSREERQSLHYERFHYPHPRVQIRMEALYLKSKNLPHSEICRLTQISEKSLSKWLRFYQEGGLARIKQFGSGGSASQLAPHAKDLQESFEKNPPQTSAEAQQRIEQLTGIQRSPSQVKAFLRREGFRYRKVGCLPGPLPDEDKLQQQEDFERHQLQPRLEEARLHQRVVLFVDAAHFVMGAFLGYLWCRAKLCLPSSSGRKRWNVLGALNAVSKELITVTNSTYINAESFCLLLDRVAQTYIGLPITLFLDNARYQKCAKVFEHAQKLHIELLYLPSYSPHLNLIERFWRFVKKESLYSKHYDRFEDFSKAIDRCIEQAPIHQKEKLNSLLSWNFQSIRKMNFSPV